MPYIEWRGNKCRVKWWSGEYLANGRKKYESKSGFDDEETAYTYGLDREYEVRHGTRMATSRSDLLMDEYGSEVWLPDQDLRPGSVKRYRSILKAQINKQWDRRRVNEIEPPEYIAWKNALHQKVERKELARTYVDDILMVFGMLMTDAVQRYRLRTDTPIPPPTPRRGRYVKKVRKKKRPLAMGPVYQLAVNAYTVWGFTGWTYIWDAAFQGMRPGEMFGLQKVYAAPAWPTSEPDREQRKEFQERYARMPATRVQFQHQWVDGKKTLTAPKYDSHRTLVQAPFLTAMHTALAASHTSPWSFPSINGGTLLGASFGRDYWWPIRDGAPAREGLRGLPRPAIPPVEEFAVGGWPIYRLRHWMKECLEEEGHSDTAIETRMGHELAGVKGLYSNLTLKMEQNIVEAQQERWEGFLPGSRRPVDATVSHSSPSRPDDGLIFPGRSPGRRGCQVSVRFTAPGAAARVVARERSTAACGRFGQHVVASTGWRAQSGHTYLLAAGSRAVTGIEVAGAVRASAAGRVLAVRAPANAQAQVSARLTGGGTLAEVGRSTED
ncbi:N-terminal phage integrase SAM-like domain-containing protein [Streptomyces monomycini]|uniref:N-terminal phage integrase SAM-like domain-containing protein n=1 Tax=Streptomyces monomycini TaxID=371720 RepID=UPI001EEAF08A|nr:N-terminal phage integrase SAM-like domain-containing protein [Streptomyces monomycini]